MIRRRSSPDGLPFRVYERRGVRTYSIGHKAADGTWSFRLQCPIDQPGKIAELRRDAIRRAHDIGTPAPADGSFAALAKAWLQWQHAMPDGAAGKRAASTLAENEREIAVLIKAFGRMQVAQMEKADAYEFLDACVLARRAAKGNKEVSLARTILEYGVRKRWVRVNPFDRFEKLLTTTTQHLVSDQDLALALEVGRRMGTPQHIVALGLRTAWLCVRRSVEVRDLTRDQITPDGIVWEAAKRQHGEAKKFGLIEWSPALRETIDEALAIERGKLAGAWHLFGNTRGQRYTKGGWKSTLSKLMAECIAEAARRRIAFAPFSLQDCRPKGVSDKLARGDRDTQDATMHSSERMLRQVYDRRRVRVAKPAG
jgi:integrase